jgi:IS605 OrfB family transposase
MIRSSKSSLKFTNTSKRELINNFVDEYKSVVSKLIDKLWIEDNLPKYVSFEHTADLQTWLSARAVQCAGKQAIGVVRGTKTKQKRRLWMIAKFHEQGKHKQARKLQRFYDQVSVSKPDLKNVEPELDSRFIKIELKEDATFDGWITISCLGNGVAINVPFKKHRHFNKLQNAGILKKGIRLSKHNITFMFDLPEPTPRTEGSTIGIDIGQISTISASTGQQVNSDPHGHTYQSICEKLARRKKDSNGFLRAEAQRTNFINWSVNRLNLSGVKTVNREKIKYLRKGKRTSRVMSHWNYAELVDKLDQKLEEAGVLINLVDPTYTSQRCSSCGWVRKRNRKQKKFVCSSCGFTTDADRNAAVNISLDLVPLRGKLEREKYKRNRKGFFWYEVGQEPIVPDDPQSLQK